jgi:hypothetical protein
VDCVEANIGRLCVINRKGLACYRPWRPIGLREVEAPYLLEIKHLCRHDMGVSHTSVIIIHCKLDKDRSNGQLIRAKNKFIFMWHDHSN